MPTRSNPTARACRLTRSARSRASLPWFSIAPFRYPKRKDPARGRVFVGTPRSRSGLGRSVAREAQIGAVGLSRARHEDVLGRFDLVLAAVDHAEVLELDDLPGVEIRATFDDHF